MALPVGGRFLSVSIVVAALWCEVCRRLTSYKERWQLLPCKSWDRALTFAVRPVCLSHRATYKLEVDAVFDAAGSEVATGRDGCAHLIWPHLGG